MEVEVNEEMEVPEEGSVWRRYKTIKWFMVAVGKNWPKGELWFYAHSDGEMRKEKEPINKDVMKKVHIADFKMENKGNKWVKMKNELGQLKSQVLMLSFKYNEVKNELREVSNRYKHNVDEKNKAQNEYNKLRDKYEKLENKLKAKESKNVELTNMLKQMEDKAQDWKDKIEEVKSLGDDWFNFKLFWEMLGELKQLYECPITFSNITKPVILTSGVTIQETCFQKLKEKWVVDPFNKNLNINHKIPNRFAIKVLEIINKTEQELFKKQKDVQFEDNDALMNNDSSISCKSMDGSIEDKFSIQNLQNLIKSLADEVQSLKLELKNIKETQITWNDNIG